MTGAEFSEGIDKLGRAIDAMIAAGLDPDDPEAFETWMQENNSQLL